MAKPTIVVGGAIAQKPHRGGHTWVFLQYLLGFRRLGWEVFFLDQLEPTMCVDANGLPCAAEASVNAQYMRDVMERIGAHDSYAIVTGAGRPPIGLAERDIEARVTDAAFLLNVNGLVRDDSVLRAASRRVFLDIDPGVGQMWRALGLKDIFSGHDDYVTIGAHIGADGCPIPTCGINWITTRPPVVLEEWPVHYDDDNRWFTSVAAWRGAYGPLEYEGRTYGLRVHEFRKFVDLPRLSGQQFEVALDIHPADRRDKSLLEMRGWSLVDPAVVARDPWAYRDYIQGSSAEFMIAKSLYVDTRCGWISDRSVCYLASGKPVVMQNTAVDTIYPTGEGLVTFETVDQAVRAVGAVSRRHFDHSRAARRLAEEYFDSDVVLRQLLDDLHVA